MSIIGWEVVEGIDPRAALVAGGAKVYRGEEAIGGDVFVFERNGVAAIGFKAGIDIEYDLIRAAERGQVRCHARWHLDDDCLIVDSISLTVGNQFIGSPVWPADVRPADDDDRQWHARFRLAALGAGRRPRLPPGARRPGDETCVLSLIGEITAASGQALASDIERATGQTIVLTIDSEGGSLLGSRAIYDALVAHDCRVEVEITGSAYSGAAMVAMAGDVRRIDRHAWLMLHEATFDAGGRTAAELLRDARSLARENEGMAAIFGRRVRGGAAAARQWLAKGDMYFTAGEALDAGLVTEITSDLAPRLPSAFRVRTAPIAGPYGSIRTAQRVEPLAYGKRYPRGSVVSYGGKCWRAKRPTLCAPGSFTLPDRDPVMWERA